MMSDDSVLITNTTAANSDGISGAADTDDACNNNKNDNNSSTKNSGVVEGLREGNKTLPDRPPSPASSDECIIIGEKRNDPPQIAPPTNVSCFNYLTDYSRYDPMALQKTLFFMQFGGFSPRMLYPPLGLSEPWTAPTSNPTYAKSDPPADISAPPPIPASKTPEAVESKDKDKDVGEIVDESLPKLTTPQQSKDTFMTSPSETMTSSAGSNGPAAITNPSAVGWDHLTNAAAATSATGLGAATSAAAVSQFNSQSAAALFWPNSTANYFGNSNFNAAAPYTPDFGCQWPSQWTQNQMSRLNANASSSYSSLPFMASAMSSLTSPMRSNGRRRRNLFTQAQVNELRKAFEQDTYVKPEHREALAKRTGLTPQQVKIWFQNNRYKCKQKQKEDERVRDRGDRCSTGDDGGCDSPSSSGNDMSSLGLPHSPTMHPKMDDDGCLRDDGIKEIAYHTPDLKEAANAMPPFPSMYPTAYSNMTYGAYGPLFQMPYHTAAATANGTATSHPYM